MSSISIISPRTFNISFKVRLGEIGNLLYLVHKALLFYKARAGYIRAKTYL